MASKVGTHPFSTEINLGDALGLAIYTEGHPDYPHDDGPEEDFQGESPGSGRTPTGQQQRRRDTFGKKRRQRTLFFRVYANGDGPMPPTHKCVVTHNPNDALARQAALEREMAREDGRIRDLYIGVIKNPSSKGPSIDMSDPSVAHANKITQLSMLPISKLLSDPSLFEKHPDIVNDLINALYTMAEDMPD